MTTVWDINLFYPFVILAVIVLIVTIGLVIKGKSSDKKDTEIFVKSSDNAKEITIDTTDKMKDMHSEVIHCLPYEYEHELHSLHTDIKQTNERVEELAQDINEKLDKILHRVVELEKARRNKE